MFTKLKIDLENCYWIWKLNFNFDFTSNKWYSIYAANGVMKTSFAKIFFQLQNKQLPEDLMFPDRKVKCDIKDENWNDLSSENIFVIKPYIEDYKSARISTLLLKDTLKIKYQAEYDKIETAENILYEKIKDSWKFKNLDSVKNEILNSFLEKDIFDVILKIESNILDWVSPIYETIIYSEIFNDTAFNFLKDEKDIIKEYIERYDKLVTNSDYLWKDFNHYKAKKTGENLQKMQFFKWWHKVGFKNNKTNDFKDIYDYKVFNDIVEKEEEILLKDPAIWKILEKLNSKIKNVDLERLRDYLFNNKHILKELINIELFRKKLFIDYFKLHLDDYRDLLIKIKSWKAEIEKILMEANSDKEYWKRAINEFNTRFTVPFSLDVNNIEDILTKNQEPKIVFKFTDIYSWETVERDKNKILEVLSQWEKRALYLLNIIFEINARKQNWIETLFIVDDIADSFDYKNKYAIIQYLKDISEVSIFNQIILTHNFDFFRTLQSRGITKYDKCLIAIKSNNKIELIKAEWIKNIFVYDWKINICNCNKKLIASISFIRNLIEYTKWVNDSNYKLLTSLLHDKNNTNSILISDLENIFNYTFWERITLQNKNITIFSLIISEANNIESSPHVIWLNLENKIILSIAIRLISEKFMKRKIIDSVFLTNLEVSENQTWKLFSKYNNDFCNISSEKENLNIIKEMMIMTPENIHVNSFMYEPILDMSDEHLVKLYRKVRDDLI